MMHYETIKDRENFLLREKGISRNFCLWLFSTEIYRRLSMLQLERLVEYVGEALHSGEVDISEDDWEHIVHMETGESSKCLVCLIRDDLHDYKLYWRYVNETETR